MLQQSGIVEEVERRLPEDDNSEDNCSQPIEQAGEDVEWSLPEGEDLEESRGDQGKVSIGIDKSLEANMVKRGQRVKVRPPRLADCITKPKLDLSLD